ncbi:MAG: hypothetical protein AAF480_15870 [Actinomycetota bacterium]
MKTETPQIETLYRQVRGDHERRVVEAERRLHHTGGRPLRPGFRRVLGTAASWIATVVRPRTRRPVEADWSRPCGCDPAMTAGPRVEGLR